ncbi:MAG: DUF47 family protein [Phycisphaerae bacterium]|nr:DUF47 family protein [Phycisphaerae bacterium]
MFSIIPKDTGFFDLMEQSAAIVIRAAEAYVRLMREYGQAGEIIQSIRQLEHTGDEIVHNTLDKLDKTFITPFDREDIQQLMKRMDDVVDEVDASAKRMALYKIEQPTTWLSKQAEVLLEACRLVGQAIGKLRDIKRVDGLQELLVRIRKLESIGDDNNHAAVAELYDTTTEPILAMKLKEIYDRTERAIDRCDDIANTIEAIVLKNT